MVRWATTAHEKRVLVRGRGAAMPMIASIFTSGSRPTASTHLAGTGRRRSYYPLPGAYGLESEDGQERRPARVIDAFREVMVLDHVGRLQLFMIDRIVGSDQGERCLVVEVLTLAAYRLMRPR